MSSVFLSNSVPFDFLHPEVSFVSSSDAVYRLIPYSYEDDRLVISFESLGHLEFPASFLASLPRQKGSFVSIWRGQECYVFALVSRKNGTFESSLASVVSSLPSSMSPLALVLNDAEFSDKSLISELFMKCKRPWSLKTSQSQETSRSIALLVNDPSQHDTRLGVALGRTQSLVQQWVNMPSNTLTPTLFAEHVRSFIETQGLQGVTLEVHGRDFLEREGMGSFLGVAQGSSEAPVLMVLRYEPSLNSSSNPSAVLVGKGLTFDAGGISLKPSAGMDAMKGDMAGAATALASIFYASLAGLDCSLVAVAACCENMPDAQAIKPGDVLKASNGTTIEVLDTDAEGRLVLADALLFAQRFNGQVMIDMATLTGACITALGHVHTGLFSNDDALAQALLEAGKASGDVAWRLPMEDAHEDMLESKVADISNLCIGKGAGAQNGAIFLKRFAPTTPWCHLDIAGTSALKGSGATGRPLPMISSYLDSLGGGKRS